MPEAEQSSRKTHTTDDNPSPLHSSTHHTDPSHMGAGQFRATPTPEMSRLYEEEKARMCQQIDEKVNIFVYFVLYIIIQKLKLQNYSTAINYHYPKLYDI